MSEKDRLHEACTRVIELYFQDIPLIQAIEQGKEYYNELSKDAVDG